MTFPTNFFIRQNRASHNSCLIKTQKKLLYCTTRRRTKNAIFIFADDIFSLKTKTICLFSTKAPKLGYMHPQEYILTFQGVRALNELWRKWFSQRENLFFGLHRFLVQKLGICGCRERRDELIFWCGPMVIQPIANIENTGGSWFIFNLSYLVRF